MTLRRPSPSPMEDFPLFWATFAFSERQDPPPSKKLDIRAAQFGCSGQWRGANDLGRVIVPRYRLSGVWWLEYLSKKIDEKLQVDLLQAFTNSLQQQYATHAYLLDCTNDHKQAMAIKKCLFTTRISHGGQFGIEKRPSKWRLPSKCHPLYTKMSTLFPEHLSLGKLKK